MRYLQGYHYIFSILALWTILSSCAGMGKPADEPGNGPEGVKYRAEIRGIDDSMILKRLEALSETISPGGTLPAANKLHLAARAERDAELFLRILRAEGFYGARITFSLQEKDGYTLITFLAEPGPAYTVEEVRIIIGREETGITLPEDSATALKVGSRITAAKVISVRESLLKKVRSQGFPFASVKEPSVTIEHGRQKAAVLFLIEPGPAVRFGEVTIKGLGEVKEEYVRKLIPFRENDIFNPDMLEQTRSSLLDSGLFSTARVITGEHTDIDGRLPVAVEVTERRHRSILLGLSYRSDERLGAKVSWENRNLRGNGERLSAEARVSAIYSGLETSYLIPVFLDEGQRLKIYSKLSEERPDAYTSMASDFKALLERRFGSGLVAGAAAGLKISRVEQQDSSGDFTLFSFPVSISRDTSDDVFDPRRGGKTIFQATPVHDLRLRDLTYVKTLATGTYYLSLPKMPRYVLAARASAGSILGQSRQAIPADERFYAGGGGSIRGYAFQSVGPVSASGSPTGGRSLVEFSLELRAKLTEKIGLVLFADAGSSFSSRTPLRDEHVRWACGLGIRYFTPVGPLRADIGVPLERRADLDDPFQFYVSIGQAF